MNDVEFITLGKDAKDVTGLRFGRLIALGPIGHKGSKIKWLCQCDCGKTTEVDGTSLRIGNTKSCGCLHTDIRRTRTKTHGMSKHPLYRKWSGIITRCENPNERGYANWGGRGIGICKEWRNDFQAFYKHVSKLPHCGEKGYSLDRVDNNDDYKPGNVRWATTVDQARNMRKNLMVAYRGRTQCLAAWAVELDIRYALLQRRLARGWSMEEAVVTPVRAKYHRKEKQS